MLFEVVSRPLTTLLAKSWPGIGFASVGMVGGTRCCPGGRCGTPQYHHHPVIGRMTISGGKAVLNRSLNFSSARSHSIFLSKASPFSSGVPACVTCVQAWL